ncbi:ABC transporter ATP-binding protein [Bacillus alveayuensis]|jgi:energy-coupling factor transport system ATP-binding protein|uniref:ABC transporter ATP-binding protein n=1 Tax=Aeribacillus alveayuensis TaxID=279215 RepID=UPI0005CD76B8|nr:ATP-binding cassette domain-containing protein [Bacillus alveayuensis]
MNVAAQVKNLRLKFPGEESLIFKDLSSSFYEGEKVLVLGPSGCGKSTLIQVLSGLIPKSMEVPMKAENIITPSSWGYVFQDPDTQFCMPYVDEEMAFVLENLQVKRENMPSQIRKYLEMVGLEFDDLHVKIQTLSGGMKQRLAIASVLALEPDVLFLDEPTAMLDPKGTKEVWDTIKRVAKDKTVIIVEHKIDYVLDIVDRIILFNQQGQIIADGAKEEIFTHFRQEIRQDGIWYPGVWEEYLREKRDFYKKKPSEKKVVLELEHFKGYRKKDVKINVPYGKVYEGEWIVIVGQNGAGKSTLLQALMQLLQTTGSYTLFNTPVEKVKKLSNTLTFVFQNPEFQFVTNSVYDEIAYSLRLEQMNEQEIQQKVEEMLELFHLQKHRKQHPYQLSMGQKRRLSVAASIVKKQPIILLDEPTFGQDSFNTFQLLELLEHYRKEGTTIFMVTHDQQIANHIATRMWVIENGQLVKDVVTTSRKESVQEDEQWILNSK